MKALFIAFMFSFSSIVLAGDREASGTVKVSGNSGLIFVTISGSNATCGNRYFLELNSEYNKALFSMMLAAHMSDKRVWVNGSGSCVSDYPYKNAYRLVNVTIY